MTRLLVSVRSAAEAQLALAGGADLIDVKEPSRGSLGAASGEVLADVLRTVGGVVPVSAAAGELLEYHPGSELSHQRGLAYIKFGLAGCATTPDWATRWLAACRPLQPRQRVAVAYADWAAARAPALVEVLATAVTYGAGVALVDTWDKRAGDLLTHWSVSEVHHFAASARERGLQTALAGSLTLETITRLLPGPFDWIAVRGAACRTGRESVIDLERVQQLEQLVHGASGNEPRRATPSEFAIAEACP